MQLGGETPIACCLPPILVFTGFSVSLQLAVFKLPRVLKEYV